MESKLLGDKVRNERIFNVVIKFSQILQKTLIIKHEFVSLLINQLIS